jgi:hypothetical protein
MFVICLSVLNAGDAGRGGLLASDPSTEGLAGVAFQEGGDGTKSGRKKYVQQLFLDVLCL